MEDASRIMYKIANVLNWILLVLCVGLMIAGIVFIANPTGILNGGNYTVNGAPATADDIRGAGITLVIIAVWCIIIDVLFIVFTRIAAKKDSSQGWDILFLVLGILSASIFYFLGGLFGVIAKNQTSTPAAK
jgi:phosphoglycerol transferase MdoB-like AlkP superfamily enzyme